MSILYSLLAFAPFLVHSWTLIDTLNGNTWQDNMHIETVSCISYNNMIERHSRNLQGTMNSEYVTYLAKDAAISSGLIQNRNGQLYLGVDSWSILNPNGAGRNSVRIRSNKAYNAGTLVIGDFAHIPANVCGIWPSFWLVGPSWPGDGEIDILEGVNQMNQNQITIHTKPGCVPQVGSEGQTGAITANADCGAGGGGVGCGVFNTRPTSWGNGFNAAGGGVYAMLWTSSSIKVWQFQQGQIPSDISNGAPWPESWGTPVANWVGCDFSQLMNNMNIVGNVRASCNGIADKALDCEYRLLWWLGWRRLGIRVLRVRFKHLPTIRCC
jgi:hypothetical protein